VNIALCLFLIPYILRQTGLASSWPRFKEMVVFGLPLIPSNFLAYIVNVSDRYFVNAFSGLTATGLYTLGYRFGILVNEFVASPFGQTWIPRRYEMYKKGDSERVFAKIFTYFSALIFFVGLGIAVVTKDVIQVMSDEAYWSAYGVVPIITLSYIFASFQMHFNIGIMIEKKTKYILYINMVTAALNLGLNYFMIKEWGMWGAAWATLISFVGKVVLVYWISNRLVRLVVEWGRVFKLTALAGLMYWPLTQIESGNPILNVLLKSLACLGYPFLLYAVGFFEPGEIRKGWDLARPFLGKVIPAFRR
jgi:O-antigen/teichoic acid export membrane protein